MPPPWGIGFPPPPIGIGLAPPWAGAVIDALALGKFRNDYDPRTGVIEARAGKDRLRPGIADVSAERLRDPHVRFFAARNPGHARGDELCCIAPLTRANFTTAAYRVPAIAGCRHRAAAPCFHTALDEHTMHAGCHPSSISRRCTASGTVV